MKMASEIETTLALIKNTSLRAVSSELSLLSQPDGSASFNQGDTSVLAAVYGPAEVKANREQIDKATVEVLYKPKVGLPGCAERQVESVIRSCVQSAVLSSLLPRSLLSVVVQQVQDCGAFLACCVNATCMALLDAAYPMRFTFAAVACMYSEGKDKGDQLILDPTTRQEHKARAQFTFIFADSTRVVRNVTEESLSETSTQAQQKKDHDLVACHCFGAFSKQDYQKALAVSRDASVQIFEFYTNTMRKKLQLNTST